MGSGFIHLTCKSSFSLLEGMADVETLAEVAAKQGFPALDLVGWNGIVTPKGTPQAIVDRMSLEIQKIIQSPEGKKRILELGLLPTGTTAKEFVNIVKRDTPRWGEVFKASGVKPE
jgi:tripartite-type tricarboxylate transporter receptor subunit TctC